MPLEEVSAKVRAGGPLDEEADVDLPVWAGVLPLGPQAGPARPDPANQPGLDPPPYLRQPDRWGPRPGSDRS